MISVILFAQSLSTIQLDTRLREHFLSECLAAQTAEVCEARWTEFIERRDEKTAELIETQLKDWKDPLADPKVRTIIENPPE